MHVVYERCCGLDVHKKIVVACLITLTAKGPHCAMSNLTRR